MSFSIDHLRTRRARASDLPALWRLETSSHKEDLWKWSDFQRYLSSPDRHLLVRVDTSNDHHAGFIAFRVDRARASVYVTNVVVAPAIRRHGVGTSLLLLVASLPEAFAPRSFARKALVRESDLPSQLWLRAAGWKCVTLLSQAFDCPPESACSFRFDPPLVP